MNNEVRLRKMIEAVSHRLETLEKSLGTAPASVSAPVVQDDSKVVALEQSVKSMLTDMDTKVSQSLDELLIRVSDLEKLKSIVSAVDGMSLHVELLHKRLAQLEDKVSSLVVAPPAPEAVEEEETA